MSCPKWEQASRLLLSSFNGAALDRARKSSVVRASLPAWVLNPATSKVAGVLTLVLYPRLRPPTAHRLYRSRERPTRVARAG